MATKVIDYLRDSNGALIIENGDFKKGEATLKHQHTLLVAHKGDFKYSPTQGVGINDFVDDEGGADELKSIIIDEFERDGMKVNKMFYDSDGEFRIVAYYE